MSKKVNIETEFSLGPLVGIANRLLMNMLNRALVESGHDITMEQWIILRKLWNGEEGISQQSIADDFHKNKASITSLLDNMEKRNLVVRIPHMNDRRNKMIYLTPYGKSLEKELSETVYRHTRNTTDGMTSADIKVTEKVLKQLIKNISGIDIEVSTIL